MIRASMFIATLVVLAESLGLYGCGGKGAECQADADCPAGRYCLAGRCTFDCATDADCRSGLRCTGRGRCEPGCVKSNNGVEACDGADNDCDGSTDEDFGDLGTACANGGCPEGLWVCTADGLDVRCDGPEPAVDDATCDGLDDDCDGLTDEDAVDRDCPLQQGVCAGAGQTCLGAAGYSDCDYGPEYTADLDAGCDRIDTDCDGATDEDAAVVLAAELGAQATDGIDNNCNGLVDEPGGVLLPLPFAPGVWMAAYEAGVYENADCTGQLYGLDGDDYPAGWPVEGDAQVDVYACALPAARPSGSLSWYRARRACEAQGMRLCSADEWRIACAGQTSNAFPYGPQFGPGLCNDYEAGLDQSASAGAFEACVSEDGFYDMSGNLREWLQDWVVDEPLCPDCASTAGFAYRCEICYEGVDCHLCDPGDSEDMQHLLIGYGCRARAKTYERFPRAMALDVLGTRCCYEP